MSRAFTDTQYLRVAAHPDFDAASAVTLECWAYPTAQADPSSQHLVSKFPAYLLRLHREAAIAGFSFTVYVGGVERRVAVGALPTLERWYHLAGAYGGGSLRLRVYDAVTRTATTYSSAVSGTLDTAPTADLWIGQYQTPQTLTQYQGRLAGVRVWRDRALSDAEIDAARFVPVYRLAA